MHSTAPENKYSAGQTLLIDKPLHWTSFQVVKKLRYHLQKKLGLKKLKVGHAGTLDPLATGLLVICTGRATKSIADIQAAPKTYTGTFTVGATTPSFDLETEPDAHFPTKHLTPALLAETAEKLTGPQQQMPPQFSAKLVDGKRAYESARKGVEVELRPNLIEIFSFRLTRIELPNVDFEISCSKGTYIRSVVRDFGNLIHSGAYLSALRREKIGAYSVAEAKTPEAFLAEELGVEI